MLRARTAKWLVAVSLTLLPTVLPAATSLQARLRLAVAWTDNAYNAPPPRNFSDFYFNIAPSLILANATPRLVQELVYEFDARLFTTLTDANTYAQRLTWNGFVFASRATDLLLAANLALARTNTISLLGPSEVTPVAASPSQPLNFASGGVAEQFGWDISRRWRFVQTAGFSFLTPVQPLGGSTTLTFDQTLGIDHTWRTDALGLVLQSTLTDFTEVRGPTFDAASQTVIDTVLARETMYLINSALVRWRHDYGRYFSTEAGLGFIEAHAQKGIDNGAAFWHPRAIAAFRFFHDWGSADAIYQHTVTANPFLQTAFVSDLAELRFGLPLGRDTGARMGASAGYGYLQGLDFFTGAPFNAAHVISADGTIDYTPPRRREISIFARYQYFNQLSDTAVTADARALISFSRHTVMIGITGTYPAVSAAQVPRTQGSRVDRADAPRIPNPTSHEPQRR